ncbi:MAG: TrbC/VirB2 family protein [Clostridia bacterium]|nr:TrbC/VirB2 family protein [Clostridia bacterium]
MLKNNKMLKITLVAMIVVSVLLILAGNILASDFDVKGYIPSANPSASGVGSVKNFGGTILSIFQAVGTSIAVIMLVWLGIKYIMASPDGKAEIKKQAFAYVLGAVLLFGAVWLVPWIATLVGGMKIG